MNLDLTYGGHTAREILSIIDHTLLKPDMCEHELYSHIDDCVAYGTATACIPAAFVKRAVDCSNGRVRICSVAGFPFGYYKTEVKLFEAERCLADGADEVDMVINIGWLKDKKYDLLLSEISDMKKVCGDHILKVITETCLLTDDEKIKICEIVTESGADFIKTSTGFAGPGATPHDIEIFAAHAGNNLKIKAAGGIKTLDDAALYMNLGVSRIGSSAIVRDLKKNG